MTKDEKRKTKVKGKYTPKVDLEGLARYFAAQPDVVVAYLDRLPRAWRIPRVTWTLLFYSICT